MTATDLVPTHKHLEGADLWRKALAHVLAYLREALGKIVGNLSAVSIDVSVVEACTGQVNNLRLGYHIKIQVLVNYTCPGLR